MHYKAAVVALAGAAAAQDMSICDKYTQALTMANTAANQKTVLTLVVNTALIGNYSNMSKSAVTGILKDGMYQGQQVSLAKYFDGSMPVANRNNMPTSVNFLDGGGVTPLQQNMPGSDGSNQARLVNHLYSYFGLLLGCTMVGQDGFPAYDGDNSQYDVHKFMKISAPEFGYFVSQVGASAKSFGVTDDDVTTAANALMMTFGYKCTPAAAVGGGQPMLQSICTGDGCPTDPNANCAAYADGSTGSGAAGGSEGSSSSMAAGGSMTMSGSEMPSGTMTMSGGDMPAGTMGAMPSSTTGAAPRANAHLEGLLAAACGAIAML